MTDASPWARSLVRSLVACGLRHACICPGSRSTPLVLALHQHPDIHTPVLHDERTAAFLALGLARATRRPTAVVCTSGSAAAHLLPAITEAAADDLPLLLLTADRPPELHHCGAPQVMDQQRLFGTHVRAFHDPGPPWTPPAHSRTPSPDPLDHIADTARRAFRDALGTPHHRPGPVHLNLPFREPLSPPEPLPGPPQGPTRTSAHP
ncbi:MAG: 2-succinyl-5-enolpyruvyl-6-hydroxy-3-cyclohexene-1-carboxylate synthase, partial [Deltaproteobacteria bacterium]